MNCSASRLFRHELCESSSPVTVRVVCLQPWFDFSMCLTLFLRDRSYKVGAANPATLRWTLIRFDHRFERFPPWVPLFLLSGFGLTKSCRHFHYSSSGGMPLQANLRVLVLMFLHSLFLRRVYRCKWSYRWHELKISLFGAISKWRQQSPYNRASESDLCVTH